MSQRSTKVRLRFDYGRSTERWNRWNRRVSSPSSASTVRLLVFYFLSMESYGQHHPRI